MKKRLLGAVILLGVLLPIVFLGGVYFSIGVSVIAILGMYELINLRKTKKSIPLAIEILTYILVAYLVTNQFGTNQFVIKLDYRVLSFLIFVFFFPVLMISDNEKYNLNDAFFLFGSTLFLGLSCNLVVIIRNYSLSYLFYLLIVTMLTDIFAYISGSMVGKHKLCPNISPNKSVEGLIGGTFMGVVGATLFYVTVINPEISLPTIILVSLSLSLIGQLGDLVFSSMKRHYNKKDFSNLIPGHGGILDRFDSFIFVSLAAVIFLPML